MTSIGKHARNLSRFFGHDRQPISHWQRSTTPGDLWVAQAFTLYPFGGSYVFSTFGHDAMSIVECLRWQTFAAAQDDAWSTEAKSGVPRYDGEVSRLAEYQFRVRLRQAREKAMDGSEVKKLDPLALRLMDGLRSCSISSPSFACGPPGRRRWHQRPPQGPAELFATQVTTGSKRSASDRGTIFFPRVRTPCGHGAQVIVEGREEQSDGGEKNKDPQTKPKPNTPSP